MPDGCAHFCASRNGRQTEPCFKMALCKLHAQRGAWVLTCAIIAVLCWRHSLTECHPSAASARAVHVSDCTPELLYEKRPVVLVDRVVNHEQLLCTVFRWQFMAASTGAMLRSGDAPIVAHARFTLLCAPHAEMCDAVEWHVDVRHPVAGTSHVTRVILRGGQTLVLPSGWVFNVAMASITAEPLRVLNLSDTVHLVRRPFVAP